MRKSLDHEPGAMQLEKPVIRTAKRNDAAVLQVMADTMKSAKVSGYFEQSLALQAQGERTVFIAESGGKEAGYCMLSWRPKYAFFRAMEIPEIQDLNVLPRFRRKGIGTAMIAHCEDLARGRRYKQMGIGVGMDASYGPAQRLYVKLGYVPDGHGVTYDRVRVGFGEIRPIDDDLSLMLVKDLQN